MKQHLIAIDLDGTTLNNQSKLTPTTIKTLQTLSRQGHLVSIVTGRPYLISGHLYDQIGLKTPMINFNGALGHIPHRKWAGEYAVNVFVTDRHDQRGTVLRIEGFIPDRRRGNAVFVTPHQQLQEAHQRRPEPGGDPTEQHGEQQKNAAL